MHKCKRRLTMQDKHDICVPFKSSAVSKIESEIEGYSSYFVDWKKYQTWPTYAPDVSNIEGLPVIECWEPRKWDSISSGFAGIAVGFFPEGEGFGTFPCVRIKCSPAKIVQGHNVFGSEFGHVGMLKMIKTFCDNYPQIFEDLDFNNAKFRYMDFTFSTRLSEFFGTRIFPIFESLAHRNQAKRKNENYLQISPNSDRVRLKLYSKHQEVLADIKQCEKKRSPRLEIISNPDLVSFTKGLYRFEATIGPRKFEQLGIPVNIWEFLFFEQWFYKTHGYTVSQYLWQVAFDPLFSQFEGCAMSKVDDYEIQKKISVKHDKVKDDGKICKRRSNAVFKTFRDIKRDGYKALCKENNKTFFRNVSFLIEAGIQEAFLKTIEPEGFNNNVVPFIQIIKIDFKNQRPHWYVEPSLGVTELQTPLGLLKLAS
jgi:II/X family phage/plasmid replication protein